MTTHTKPQDIYRTSARRFSDHYREYSRINEKDFDALSSEIDNIFSSVGLYGDLKAWQEVAQMIQLIDDFLDAYGYWEELVAGYHVAIESVERYFWAQGRDPKPETWHQRVLLRAQLSLLLFRRGEYQEARSHAAEAMRIARRIKHGELQALASSTLGAIAMAQGKFRESEGLFEDARFLLDGKVVTRDVLLQLRQKGILADTKGDLDKAWEFYEKRANLALESENNLDAAESLYSLGDIEQTKHNYEEAERLYEQSQRFYEKSQSPIGLSNVLNRKAQLFIRTNRFQEAQAILNRQLEIEREHGDKASLLDALQDIASNYMDLDEINLAEQYYKEGDELANKLGNLPAQAISLQGLGFIEQIRGNTAKANDYYLRSLGIARSSGHPKLISAVLSRLGILAWNEQDYRAARDYFNEVLKFERKLDRKDQIARTMITLGDIARFEGELQIAERNYNKAIKMFSDLKNNDGIADCLISLSSVLFQKGRYDRAWELLVRSLDIGDLKNDVYLSSQVIERISDFVSIAKYEEEATELAKRISKSSSN
jgi:tetratricopeptide (TPR) repeat protein